MWVERLKKSSPESRLYLVGNKNDLVDVRQTIKEEGQEIKDRLHMESFFETSAKTGDHIQEAFEDMARLLVESHHHKSGEN